MTEITIDEVWGREIKSAVLSDDTLRLIFTDGVSAEIRDTAQSCCEKRYITCDDDVSSLVGGVIRSITEKPGGDVSKDSYDVHDTMFVEIQTNQGFVTLTTHNEHNGYYGGFSVEVKITHRPLSTMRLPQ